MDPDGNINNDFFWNTATRYVTHSCDFEETNGERFFDMAEFPSEECKFGCIALDDKYDLAMQHQATRLEFEDHMFDWLKYWVALPQKKDFQITKLEFDMGGGPVWETHYWPRLMDVCEFGVNLTVIIKRKEQIPSLPKNKNITFATKFSMVPWRQDKRWGGGLGFSEEYQKNLKQMGDTVGWLR